MYGGLLLAVLIYLKDAVFFAKGRTTRVIVR